MNVLIVSGFLGAGKTTFIKEMCRKAGREFVVMENEFGGADVDGAILKEEPKMNIWELAEGCICCNMKSNFAESVLAVANTLDPNILIVEPSGIGSLSRVTENIRQIVYDRIQLLSPVTIISGDSLWLRTSETKELFDDQIKYAGTVIFSKTDRNGAPSEKMMRFVRGLNPHARIITEHYSGMDKQIWDDILSTKLSGEKIPVIPEPQIQNITVKNAVLPSPAALAALLENIVGGRFGNIYRAKGFVKCGGEILRFDAADGRYSICGFDGEVESPAAVFIGLGIDRSLNFAFDGQAARNINLASQKLNARPQRKPKILYNK